MNNQFPESPLCNCGALATLPVPCCGQDNVLIWHCISGHSTRVTYCSQDAVNAIKAHFQAQKVA